MDKLANAEKKVREIIISDCLKHKVLSEGVLVGALWKNLENFITYQVQSEHIFDNNYRVLFVIAHDLYKEGKMEASEIEVGVYLEKHPKLKKVFDEVGGYDTIEDLKALASEKNIEGYFAEFNKWWTIWQLLLKGLIDYTIYKKCIDLPLEEVYDLLTANLNHLFIHADDDIKTHNICSGLDMVIQQADKGALMGLPLWGSPKMTREIKGLRLGEVTMLAGSSGVGKSALMIKWLFPSIFEYDEKIVVILNEQDENKFRREMLTWVANNICHGKFNKSRFSEGNFTEEEKALLYKAKAWLEERESKRNITIVPLKRYSVNLVTKIINKYSAMGVKYFALDTFKLDTSNKGDQFWLAMQNDSVKLYDAVKPATNNVSLLMTVQLAKSSLKVRHLTMDNIGMAKNIVDIASTVILARKMSEEEKANGRHALDVKVFVDKEGHSVKKTIPQGADKNYNILFIAKNREGITDGYQVVVDNDLGHNTYKEVGICWVPED